MTNKQLIILAFDKGYRVVEGNVISPSGKKLSLYCYKKIKRGYLSFGLKVPGKRNVRRVNVHQLLGYQKFGETMFNDGMVIRHKDDNRFSNIADNILLGTQLQNILDRSKESRLAHAINTSTYIRKFSDLVVLEIKEKHNNGSTYRDLMKEYGITSKGTMSHIIHSIYVTTK